MAHVIPVPERPMDATDRCDRCGAQAYYELALENGTLLFCAHHARQHEDKINEIPSAMVADHRPFLEKEEGKPRDAAAAPR